MSARAQYRANWVRSDYAERRKRGQCTRCPSKTMRWLCAACMRVRKLKAV